MQASLIHQRQLNGKLRSLEWDHATNINTGTIIVFYIKSKPETSKIHHIYHFLSNIIHRTNKKEKEKNIRHSGIVPRSPCRNFTTLTVTPPELSAKEFGAQNLANA